MNGKTAKILNRLARLTKVDPRGLKRSWKQAKNARERASIRRRAKAELRKAGW